MTNIEFPSNVTTVNANAFYNCGGLTSVTIPASVSGIGKEAFGKCTGLTDIIYNATACADFTNTDGQLPFMRAGTSAGLRLTVGANVTKIPAYMFYGAIADGIGGGVAEIIFVGGSKCKSIGEYAFQGNNKLSGVSIPDSVTGIGSRAFYNCTGLTAITIGSGLNSWSDDAFTGCSGLSGISVDSGNATFSGQDGILYNKLKTVIQFVPQAISGNITLPNTLTGSIIGAAAFKNCNKLTGIVIPDGVTGIGNEAFYGCSGLLTVTIGTGVTVIGIDAFRNCSGLVSVNSGKSVTTINSGAFQGGENLQSIVISEKVTKIDYSAFTYCSALAKVYYGGYYDEQPTTVSDWNGITINMYNDNLKAATRYYYSGTALADGSHWHYDTDGVTPILWA
ncbi:MAG: leucine-rich repeat domain-containing protein [Clostridiales bacterium]|nr:leucine-rich repeat domain-containing protein [Clostridiales bacterium]